MLVLQRKILDAVVIDNRVTVTVVQLNSSAVRLGFDAPADVEIRRAELPAGRYPPPGREVGQADDAEPVDEEWLRSLGFNPGKLPFCLSVLGGEGGEVAVDVTLPVEGMEEADSLWVQGELVKVSPTRGHVRRLCAALGITLGITSAPSDPRAPELGGEG